MGIYIIYVFCDDCSETHPLHIPIALQDGPPEKESIGNAYAGREIPAELRLIFHNNSTICPKTHRFIKQVGTPDYYNSFLVPVTE